MLQQVLNKDKVQNATSNVLKKTLVQYATSAEQDVSASFFVARPNKKGNLHLLLNSKEMERGEKNMLIAERELIATTSIFTV